MTGNRAAPLTPWRPALLEMLGDNPELLRELVEMFCEDCPKQMAVIREAMEQRDARMLHAAAHLLRGTIGNFEQAGAYAAVCHLEVLGRSGRLDGADACYASLESAVNELQAALSELVPTAT